MRLDFQTLDAAEAYRWMTATVTPRPIAWVSTRSADDVDNLAPFSFFQIVCDEPPTLMLSIGPRVDGSEKDTLRNLRERGELAIQLVSAAQATLMNETSASFPYGVSEFAQCGVEALACERIAPMRVVGAPVTFECRLAAIQPYPAQTPSHHIVFAEILLAHIDVAALADARHVDPAKLDLVGRLGGTGYTTTRDLIHLRRPV